jgi:hypothetical protein
MNVIEINGGQVREGEVTRLTVVPGVKGYTNAQIDDYHGLRRSRFLWEPESELSLKARFSSEEDQILGTAGFGFWNAPFGDAGYPWPTLPSAVWFFYASEPSDLPLNVEDSGRGWFISTIDSRLPGSLLLMPLSPVLILLNNVPRLRRSLWPVIRRKLKIDFNEIGTPMSGWLEYRLRWSQSSCEFWVDGNLIYRTASSPGSRLGFVCWIDNQYLVATPTGRFRWGTLELDNEQWLEVADLKLRHL